MTKIVIQPWQVPLGTFRLGPQDFYVQITTEWRKPLDLMAQRVNEHTTKLVELEARIVALGG